MLNSGDSATEQETDEDEAFNSVLMEPLDEWQQEHCENDGAAVSEEKLRQLCIQLRDTCKSAMASSQKHGFEAAYQRVRRHALADDAADEIPDVSTPYMLKLHVLVALEEKLSRMLTGNTSSHSASDEYSDDDDWE